LLNLLLQLLNFRRIGGLLHQLNLRDQAEVTGIAILQWDGRQHRFGIIRLVQGDLGFRQRQADIAALIAETPGVFQ
jgi:hypothetical protein